MRHGPSMLTVAALAGIDGQMVRARYIAGQIDASVLFGKQRRAA